MEVNSMTLLLVLLAIVVFLIILLYTVESKINLIFNTADSDMHLTLIWMHPLIKSVITKKADGFVLTVYLLGKSILTRQIKQKQNVYKNRNILKNLNPTDIYVNTQYGFRDPLVTGLTYTAISMVSQFFKVKSLSQNPDFLAANDYINLEANAKLNLGSSIMKLI